MSMLTVGSLFAGVGGFDYGFEQAGMETRWFSEVDPFCRQVLAARWPGVPIHGDIGRLKGEQVERVDVLCGGFPCQDLSLAGTGRGLRGERSGLWSEYARLIREVVPRWVVVENVAALRGRGLDTVLRDLASLGYDAEWCCMRASEFGARHHRDRIWLVAYPDDSGRVEQRRASAIQAEHLAAERSGTSMAGRRQRPRFPSWPAGTTFDQAWRSEPDVGRVADGVPARVDRLRALGNALVPQVAAAIGRRMVAADG